MAVSVTEGAFVVSAGQVLSLSSIFSVTASPSDPTYLVLTGLDRNEYPAGSSGATGTLTGNGASATFSSIGSDGRGVGVVFTYQSSSGRYYNSIYGYLDQMTYTVSGSLDDVANLSLFGTNSLGVANGYGNNAYSMIQYDRSGYLGSATIATQPGFTGPVPSQATPNSIAAIAQSFVGKAWNMDGCWTLVSTIAAEAGTSLPVDSSMVGAPGAANGEWIVAFDGTKQTGNWQSMVKAGEVIVIGSANGTAHITTCVSGSGSSAMLVDNITYVNSRGAVLNLANDGSSNDVTVAAPHAASEEWSGVLSSLVKIYQLDTPIVSTLMARDSLLVNASQTLAQLFSAVDPAGKAVSQFQVYDSATTDSLTVSGAMQAAHSASSAVTVSSLSSVSLVAGATACTDTVEVRAFNGSYWGDWQAFNVAVSATPSAPLLITQTANQTWTQGQKIAFTLPSSTFFDPNGQSLSYSAHQSNGQALPSWLSFNAATDSFSGTVPTGISNFNLTVTATDSSGLSVSDSFAVTVVPAAPPKVTTFGGSIAVHTTPDQTWSAGHALSFTLPANTFVDSGGVIVTTAAYQVAGPSVTGWLRYNPTAETFSGTAPASASGSVTIEVLALDSNGLMATDIFHASFANGVAAVQLVGVAAAPHAGASAFHS